MINNKKFKFAVHFSLEGSDSQSLILKLLALATVLATIANTVIRHILNRMSP